MLGVIFKEQLPENILNVKQKQLKNVLHINRDFINVIHKLVQIRVARQVSN